MIPRFAVSAFLVSVALAHAAAPAPAFVGVLASDREYLLAFQPAPAARSAWRRVGERLGDYLIADYDHTSARVTLRSSENTLSLTLREPKATATPPPALDTPEGQRLLRAAFQSLFDTAHTTATVSDPETRTLTLTLTLGPDGTTCILDATGRPLPEDSPQPVHILTPAYLSLEEIARRLRLPVAHLVTLNPVFEPHPDPVTKHTLRVR